MDFEGWVITVIYTNAVLIDAVATVVVASICVESSIVLAALDGEAAVDAIFLIHFTLVAASRELSAAFGFFGDLVFIAASLKLASSVIRQSLDKVSWTFLGMEAWSRGN